MSYLEYLKVFYTRSVYVLLIRAHIKFCGSRTFADWWVDVNITFSTYLSQDKKIIVCVFYKLCEFSNVLIFLI